MVLGYVPNVTSAKYELLMISIKFEYELMLLGGNSKSHRDTPNCTLPAACERRVFIIHNSGQVSCVDTVGKLLIRTDLNGSINFRHSHNHVIHKDGAETIFSYNYQVL